MDHIIFIFPPKNVDCSLIIWYYNPNIRLVEYLEKSELEWLSLAYIKTATPRKVPQKLQVKAYIFHGYDHVPYLRWALERHVGSSPAVGHTNWLFRVSPHFHKKYTDIVPRETFWLLSPSPTPGKCSPRQVISACLADKYRLNKQKSEIWERIEKAQRLIKGKKRFYALLKTYRHV